MHKLTRAIGLVLGAVCIVGTLGALAAATATDDDRTRTPELRIVPDKLNLHAGHTAQFTAVYPDGRNADVTWTVDEPDGGEINNEGLYRAPKLFGIYHVRATTLREPAKTATATVRVRAVYDPPE